MSASDLSNRAPADVRIVVVDDEIFTLKLMTHILARLGYTNVVACDSGARALQEMSRAEQSADLVFLDINMPGMDGVEFIRRLVELRFCGGVILVSAENDRIQESVERLVEYHNLTLLGRLGKPVAPKDISGLLSRLHVNPAATGKLRILPHAFSVEQLRAAIARNELVLHYQPKVAMATHEVVGVECLVRWQPSQGGLIYPDAFIPLAEEAGMIGEITWYVMAQAMRQGRAWREAGYPVNLAVNVSMQDFAFLNFPDKAAAMAQSIGIESSALTLEVTETCIMRQLGTVLDVLSRLRLKRFRLSIDDFGTGHSSLAQLRDLPFDELKIDRGFVHGAASHPTRRAICTASVRMAQQLKLRVVAEGVERPEDWDLLGQLGCEEVQGYMIAKPMPASQVSAWIDNWTGQHGIVDPHRA
jgi:EAL domain-containing protein (putative c-di-GMP-specific phosphodiesterase class I)/AmiR/NasT family two-component response regulator